MSEDRYCKYCGAPLQPGSTFCPKCGAKVAAVAAAGTVPPTPPPPNYKQRREKGEEKNEEKHEGEKNEKGKEGDVAGGIFGGGVLIWLGITFYLATTGVISWENQWWSYFLMGLGAMLILLGLYRGMKHGSMQPFTGFLIGGAVVMLLGVGSIFSERTWWPIWFIAIGVIVIAVVLMNLRRRPKP